MIKWVAKQEIIFVHHVCYPPCSEKSWQTTLGAKNRDHLVLKRKFYWNTAIGWCIIFACLSATTAKVSVATQTAHKAYNIPYLDLCKKEQFADSWPKETEIHMAPWWKDHASQSGEKSRAVRGEGGAQRGWWEEGVGKAGGQRGSMERDAGQQDYLRGSSGLRRQHTPSWNYFQKFTDLSANPGMHQTAAETSVQLCMPGWSRVPWEKMLSGKTLGSELEKQRQTHIRESQGGWIRGNQLPPGLCGHMSC